MLPDSPPRIPLDGDFLLCESSVSGVSPALIFSMALLLFSLGTIACFGAAGPSAGLAAGRCLQRAVRARAASLGTDNLHTRNLDTGSPNTHRLRETDMDNPSMGSRDTRQARNTAMGNRRFAGNQGYPQQPYQEANQPYQEQGFGQGQPMSAEELEQLVAPIALYPDTLVAQILAASTYPAQVAAADQWLRAQGNAPPEQIAAGASAQTSWDPSVKALTAFPQVLAMLDRNLQWTTNLGNAYYNQPQDVLQTIQVMRERAESAGNLQSTPQAEVSNNQGYIDIAPANPQMVYVPTYDPWAVYGQPVQPYPGFSLMDAVGAIGSFLGSSPVQYGLGIAM